MIKGLVKDTMVYGVGDFFFRLLSFAVFPIYAHIFSVEEYGTMALLLSMVGLICAVSELGMNNSVQRFYWDKNTPPMDRGDIVSTGLAINVGASLIFCFFLAGLFYFIRPLIWDRFQISYSLMILALMIVVPTQILEFAKNVLRLHFSPWKFTIVAAFRNGIGIALGLYLVWALDMRVEGMFAGLAFWIFSFSDRWMLGVLANGTEVGLYSIAVNFSGIVVFVTQAFGMAWSPFAMRLYSEEPEYKKIYGQVLSGLVFVIVWIAMGVTLFSPELMRLLTPREYWSASAPGFLGELACRGP
jgi:O-antigen/teichoic acid export membrane protein